MQEIIEAERERDGSDLRPRPRQRKHHKRKHEVLSDPEDEPYTSSQAGSLDSDSDTDDSTTEIITPNEVNSDPLACYFY